MTGRPPRDLRDEAKNAIARRLRREEHRAPEAFAAELLVILDGIHIGLTDTTPPHPDAIIRPPGTGIPATAETAGVAEYRAAKATHLAKDDQ